MTRRMISYESKNYDLKQGFFAFLLLTFAVLACNRFTPDSLATPTSPPPTQEPEPAAMVGPTEFPEPVDPLVGAPGLGDSLFPTFGNGGYDVDHYTLDITVNDVSTSDLTAVTTITATTTQHLSRFNFDFIGFEITSITINEEPASFERSGQELTVIPAAQLTANESFVVEIHYTGKPNKLISKSVPFPTGWVTIDGGSYVMSEPDGSARKGRLEEL